jgi:predicted DNA-binding transcriptional regulator YafY
VSVNAPTSVLVSIDYVNYRGERAWRTITPLRLYYGSTEHHPTAQWLLEAFDHGKGAVRTFAMVEMLQWNAVAA